MTRISNERSWIDWVTEFVPREARDVIVGPGDDAAVLRLASGSDLVTTVDTLVEGVHFEHDARPEDVGWKALAVNLSDLAAMGAVAKAAVMTVAVPSTWNSDRLQRLMHGIVRAAREYGVAIIGGDFSASPAGLHVTITALGETLGVDPVLRNGARVGDVLMVTGPLGGSLAGRHLSFHPRLREGRALASRHGASAMMDLSDGLGIDAARMSRASSVGMRFDAWRIPISDDAKRLARSSGRSALEHALGDGEDFELLVALPPANADAALADPEIPGLTSIGTVIEQGMELQIEDGKPIPLEETGYEHPIDPGLQ